MTVRTILALLLVSLLLPGQVVFSHRSYKERGSSYQEIWNWNPADGALQPLTNSARDHYRPLCRDGNAGTPEGDVRGITFVSPREFEPEAKLWSFDRASGEECVIGPAPQVSDDEAGKPAANGCDHFASAGGMDACAKEEDLTLRRAGKAVAHFHIQLNICLTADGKTNGPCATPIESLVWSPDKKWLIVEELGLETNSSAPQSDYYLVNAATLRLCKAVSAFEMVWLPERDQMVYVTPRELAPLPGAKRGRNVWVQQLMLNDAATGKTTAITSGVSSNRDPSLCGSESYR